MFRRVGRVPWNEPGEANQTTASAEISTEGGRSHAASPLDGSIH